jgi:hypothetical protein
MFFARPRVQTLRPVRHRGCCRPEVSRLEDRIMPALTPGGVGNDVLLTPPLRPVAVGAGEGGLPAVRAISPLGVVEREFLAYDARFRGGVRVATGDVNGDGVSDIVTAAGRGGGPHVKVFSGADGAQLASFFAYDASFRGGVFVAAGDVNGDGKADVVTGAGAGGGPHVKVFDGAALLAGTVRELRSFFAYDAAFTGGVTVAAADFDGDGKAEVVTGAGPGGGPHVKVFDGASGAVMGSFFAAGADFTGGVVVAAGAVGGFGPVVVTAIGGSPVVSLFNLQGTSLHSFFAYDLVPHAIANLSLAVRDTNSDGVGDVIVGFGPGGGPQVQIFDGTGPSFRNGFPAFDPAFTGGIFVG